MKPESEDLSICAFCALCALHQVYVHPLALREACGVPYGRVEWSDLIKAAELLHLHPKVEHQEDIHHGEKMPKPGLLHYRQQEYAVTVWSQDKDKINIQNYFGEILEWPLKKISSLEEMPSDGFFLAIDPDFSVIHNQLASQINSVKKRKALSAGGWLQILLSCLLIVLGFLWIRLLSLIQTEMYNYNWAIPLISVMLLSAVVFLSFAWWSFVFSGQRSTIWILPRKAYDENNAYSENITPDDIRYVNDITHEEDFLLPNQKTTVCYAFDKEKLNNFIKIILAEKVDMNHKLFMGNIGINYFNRKSYQNKVKTINHPSAAFDDYQQENIVDENLNNLSYLFPFGDNVKLSNLVKKQIILTLASQPSILVIHDLSSLLSPFDEIILLENIIDYRKGKTTVVLCTRKDIFSLGDQKIIVDSLLFKNAQS